MFLVRFNRLSKNIFRMCLFLFSPTDRDLSEFDLLYQEFNTFIDEKSPQNFKRINQEIFRVMDFGNINKSEQTMK